MPFKNLAHTLLATLTALVGTAAMAHGAPSGDMPMKAEYSAGSTDYRAYLPMPRSRAEVIADLEIYRRSGLAQLDASESPDAFGKAYLEAQARYQALRAAPEFKQLVARIARERGEAEATANSGMATMPQ